MGKRMGKGDCSRRRASQEIGPKTRGGESLLLLDDDCGGHVTGQDTKDDELNCTMPAGVAFEDQNRSGCSNADDGSRLLWGEIVGNVWRWRSWSCEGSLMRGERSAAGRGSVFGVRGNGRGASFSTKCWALRPIRYQSRGYGGRAGCELPLFKCYSYSINYSILFLSRPSRCPKDHKMVCPRVSRRWGSTAIITPTGVLQAGKSTGDSCPPQAGFPRHYVPRGRPSQ